MDLVNSNPKKNYFRENFYNGLTRAYLQKEVTVRLSKAQEILRSKKMGCSSLILDAARPRSVSRRMYKKMKGTKYEKFVANPENQKLLTDTMVAAGFTPLSFEWWHFNGMSKNDAIQRYIIIE